jgi:hypothetical protein
MLAPDYLRVRGWKFGDPVLDLTLTPGGVWLFTSDRARSRTPATKREGMAEQFSRAWSLLNGGLLREGNLSLRESGRYLIIRRATRRQPQIEAELDRDTLVVRRYRLFDEQGRQRMALSLEKYQIFGGGVVWPLVMRAVSNEGAITIELRQPLFNVPIADAAFVPPRRAEKLP